MNNYFLYYNEQAKVNYTFLFSLYYIAEINKDERLNNLIVYNSLNELSTKIKNKCNYNISVSSISRILNNKNYLPYFTKSANKIVLNNNFRKAAAGNKFIILNNNELSFLLEQNDNLLNCYYLYLKYYCGFSKQKQIDTTAEQILSAIGYSSKSGGNKEKLCKYNNLLVSMGFITIQKQKDNKGYCRNVYRVK